MMISTHHPATAAAVQVLGSRVGIMETMEPPCWARPVWLVLPCSECLNFSVVGWGGWTQDTDFINYNDKEGVREITVTMCGYRRLRFVRYLLMFWRLIIKHTRDENAESVRRGSSPRTPRGPLNSFSCTVDSFRGEIFDARGKGTDAVDPRNHNQRVTCV